MTTLTVWLLISMSFGTYNVGTVTPIAQFATESECVVVQNQIRTVIKGSAVVKCFEANILVLDKNK